MDATYRLALARASRLSIQVEAELTSATKSEPLLVVLHTAKEAAATALDALTTVDPDDAREIRKLQNDVQRFADLTKWLGQMLIDGPEADRQLNDTQIEDARSFVLDQGADGPGISNEGDHDD